MNPDYLQKVLEIDYNSPWQLIILLTIHTPTGCLLQKRKKERPLEWLLLPSMHKKVVTPYWVLVSTLTIKGRCRSKEPFGKDEEEIIILCSFEQAIYLIFQYETRQIAVITNMDKISHHLCKNPKPKKICRKNRTLLLLRHLIVLKILLFIITIYWIFL